MSSLKAYNTFGIDVDATELIVIDSVRDLQALDFVSANEYFILGGGSNLLLTKDVEVPVLKNEIKFKEVLSQNENFAIVEFGGGENWHETVVWSIEQGFGGIENLSLIPGTVGAAPIQNIGAYGVEIRDVIYQVHVYDLLEGKSTTFSKDACEFGYRDSFFKQIENKGRYFITSVVLKLHKDQLNVNTSYGIIQEVLDKKSIDHPSIFDVSQAVIEIRQSKLPDPAVLGNSGSFFKNPIVPTTIYDKIAESYDKVPCYPVQESFVKLPAGWLIEQCGWKGKVVGNTGNYKHQSLIVVNYGDATGAEIYAHAKNVQASVQQKFGISLDFEVNIL